MLLYHVSLEKIELDQIDWRKGIHLGSKAQGFEAVLRKCPSKYQPIYVHLFEYKVSLKDEFLCDDVRNEQEWLEQVKQARLDNKAVIKYRNRYEPDPEMPYSYLFLTQKLLKSVGAVCYNSILVEDYLDEFYQKYE